MLLCKNHDFSAPDPSGPTSSMLPMSRIEGLIGRLDGGGKRQAEPSSSCSGETGRRLLGFGFPVVEAIMLRSFGLLIPIALVACGSSSDSSSGPPPFAIAEASTFIEPWAMTFLPDGRALVT